MHQGIMQCALEHVPTGLRPTNEVSPNKRRETQRIEHAAWFCQQSVVSIETKVLHQFSNTSSSSCKNSALGVRYGSARDLQLQIVALFLRLIPSVTGTSCDNYFNKVRSIRVSFLVTLVAYTDAPVRRASADRLKASAVSRTPSASSLVRYRLTTRLTSDNLYGVRRTIVRSIRNCYG